MYIPSSNAERDLSTLFDFIEAHPFATLVTASPTEGLVATHLPLVLDRASSPSGTLIGHIARANPHHRQVADVSDALVIFTGPDAYITPDWYPTKREHGRVVPTWNYVAIHAYGALRLHEDSSFIRRHLEVLTTRQEAERMRPWHVSDAPEEFIAQQMKAIIGFELTITRLEGKWKMSQNRSATDIDGVVRGLSTSEAPMDRAVGEIVEARRPSGS